MNCVLFETRLDELLDERLPVDSDSELNEHSETCAGCAQLLADHQVLLEAIEAIIQPNSRSDLAARVVAEMATEPVSMAPEPQPAEPTRRVSVRSAMWVAATVAAALLVCVGVMEWSGSHYRFSVANSNPPKTALPNTVVEASIPSASTGNKMAARRAPIASRWVSQVQSLAGFNGAQQRTLMEQMSDGLKPVTNSMSAALNALRRVIPASETPARSS